MPRTKVDAFASSRSPAVGLLTRLTALSCLFLVPILLFVALLVAVLFDANIVDSPSYSVSSTSRAVAELHGTYRVPYALASVIPSPDQVLQALRYSSQPNDPQLHFNSKKLFIVHLCGDGRARRLQAISSALVYARLTRRVLVVLWDTTGGANVLLAVPRLKPDSKRRDVVISRVHNLVVENFDSDWAELDIAAIDVTRQVFNSAVSILDDVVALKSKHLYLRTDGLILSRYAPYPAGLADFDESLTVYRDGQQYFSEDYSDNMADLATLSTAPRSHESNFSIETDDSSDLSSVEHQNGQYERFIRQSSFGPDNHSWRSMITSRFSVFSRDVDAGAEARLQLAFQTVFHDHIFPHLNSSQIMTQLNRKFLVPHIFLSAMTERARRQLLHDLHQSKSKRAIFLHTQFGLGNRLRALGSAMAVAHAAGRVLVVIWVPDVHLNCTFGDLFANDDILVMDNLNIPWPPQKIEPIDRALSAVDFWNMMRTDEGPVHDPLVVNVDPRPNRHLYVKTAYVVRSRLTRKILKTNSPYWERMRETLVPTVDVMELVQDPNLAGINSMIGVHIRGRTLDNDIAGVKKQFYGVGSTTTDLWRRRTGFATFAAKIRSLSPKYRYFVAADKPEFIIALQREFGMNRIFSLRRMDACESRSAECVRLALADILLLSRVRTLLGSNWSSFTEAAVRLNRRVPNVYLAGIHFGRHRIRSK